MVSLLRGLTYTPFQGAIKTTFLERGFLLKGVESPFRLKPSKVVSLIKLKIDTFNMVLHTKCWKFYNVRPREMRAGFKGDYAAYIEGFDLKHPLILDD